MRSADELALMVKPANHLLAYFDQQVLASYRNEPDKYDLQTDSFEGTLTVTEKHYENLEAKGQTDDYLNIRFGYRALESGELAIVVWLPDLIDAKPHQSRWNGFRLKNPVWTDRTDERFEKWALRNLEGSWDVDNGPRLQMAEVVLVINGFTKEATGLSLYKHEIDSSLSFPSAENTHAYQDAHTKLYGFLIDGIDKRVLMQLATQAGIDGKFSSDRTLDALSKLLPSLAEPSRFAQAMATISAQRRLATHGVRPKAERMEAFSTFTSDLLLCLSALRDLISALEGLLQWDAVAACKRNSARDWLPKLIRPAHHNASVHRAAEMEGKTVAKVEIGERQDHPQLHMSEAMILHFTDGSILGIDTASNVINLASRRDDLEQNEFHVQLHLNWVPQLK